MIYIYNFIILYTSKFHTLFNKLQIQWPIWRKSMEIENEGGEMNNRGKDKLMNAQRESIVIIMELVKCDNIYTYIRVL